MNLLYKCLILFISSLVFIILYFEIIYKKTNMIDMKKKCMKYLNYNDYKKMIKWSLIFMLPKIPLLFLSLYFYACIKEIPPYIMLYTNVIPIFTGFFIGLVHGWIFDRYFNEVFGFYNTGVGYILSIDYTLTFGTIAFFFTSIVMLIGNLP